MKAEVVNRDFSKKNFGTYFRTTDVRPFVEDNKINIWNGECYRASWGASRVESTATQLTDNLVKVDVVGWHKHTISPEGGTYYFVLEGDKWVRRTANAKAVKAVIAQ